MQQSATWIALSIIATLFFLTDVQVMSYAQGPTVPAVPKYRDCTPGITLDPDANLKLENARQRAIKYINAATNALQNAPDPGSKYEEALNRHFVNATAADRATISDNYRQILPTLRVQNYICNTPNICGTEQAGWGGLTVFKYDLIHVCRAFFDPKLDITCRAIILIHEGAHDEGIDAIIGTPHSPNRGDAAYPAGNRAPPAGVTTADRMDTPDAYAFFAAHIWRSTDSGRSCF